MWSYDGLVPILTTIFIVGVIVVLAIGFMLGKLIG